MTTVDRVKLLCKERKIALSKLEKELGFANGYIGQLKRGNFPSDRLFKIAEYFEVSPQHLMGWPETQEALKNIGLSTKDIANELALPQETVESIINSGDSSAIEKIVKVADALIKNKKPALTPENELDSNLIKLLVKLTPEEITQVDAFVQGLIAARKA